MWIRLNVNEDVYDYLCTRVDDFVIDNGSHRKSLHYQRHWTAKLPSWEQLQERQARTMVHRMQKVPKRGRQAS
jgi:hypothetical protein